MRRATEIALSLLIVVALAWVVSQASSAYVSQLTGWPLPRGWGTRSGLFPTVLGVPVLALAIAQLIVALRRAPRPAEEMADAGLDLPPEVMRRRTAVIIATIGGFAAGTWLLGFVTTVPLLTFLYLKVAARESWTMSVGLSVAAGLIFYFVFVNALGVPAPPGPVMVALFG